MATTAIEPAQADPGESDRQQREDWNGDNGARWVQHQEGVDRLLARFLEAGLQAAAPRPGEHVLDVGCGCGASTLALADAIAPDGAALGVDISAPMLRRAQDRATERAGATGSTGSTVDFACADAAGHAFPAASFDLLFSRFGVMFFGDPLAAFTHLRGAMKPGGRAAFVCWRSPAENDWLRLPGEVAAPFLPPLPPMDPDAPGPFAFARPDRLAAILTGAGWQAPVLERFDHRIRLGLDPARGPAGDPVQAALDDLLRVGPLMRRLRDQPDEVRGRALGAVRAELLRQQDADGFGLNAAVWVVRAAA